jgi:Helix-turn-helix domain
MLAGLGPRPGRPRRFRLLRRYERELPARRLTSPANRGSAAPSSQRRCRGWYPSIGVRILFSNEIFRKRRPPDLVGGLRDHKEKWLPDATTLHHRADGFFVSIYVIEQVLNRSKAKGTQRLVLIAVADNARKEDGFAYPSQQTIARKAGVSIRQAQRAIPKLVELGELRVEKHHRRTDHYWVFPGNLYDTATSPKPNFLHATEGSLRDTGGSLHDIQHPLHDTGGISYTTTLSPQPSIEPLIQPSIEQPSSVTAPAVHKTVATDDELNLIIHALEKFPGDPFTPEQLDQLQTAWQVNRCGVHSCVLRSLGDKVKFPIAIFFAQIKRGDHLVMEVDLDGTPVQPVSFDEVIAALEQRWWNRNLTIEEMMAQALTTKGLEEAMAKAAAPAPPDPEQHDSKYGDGDEEEPLDLF